MSVVGFARLPYKGIISLRKAIHDSLNTAECVLSKDARNVVLKANLCYYWDFSTGHTTDPQFLSALVDLVREQTSRNATISVVEADASAMKCRYAFKVLGYEKMAQEKSIRLVNLSEDNVEKVTVTVDGHNFPVGIPRTIKEADLLINVPKIKYMTQTKISCALKNIFGANPAPSKFRLHPQLDQAIVAINKAMKFDLHILDGIIAPGNPPRRMNLVMASQDPVAFDAAASRIAGVNPKTVKHIMLAQKEGLGTIHFTPKGESLETFARLYPRKKPTTKLATLAYSLAMKIGLLSGDAF